MGPDVTGNGPARATNNPVSPVATIKAKRPLALIFILMISPFRPPDGEMRPRCVSTPGQKKGIFGPLGAKAGQFPSWRIIDGSIADACRTDRCYEPLRLEPPPERFLEARSCWSIAITNS